MAGERRGSRRPAGERRGRKASGAAARFTEGEGAAGLGSENWGRKPASATQELGWASGNYWASRYVRVYRIPVVHTRVARY
jgi:hypothetical protein